MGFLAQPAYALSELAIGIWLGAVVLLSFVVTPTVFQSLQPPHTSTFLEKLFPRYYLLGEICALILIVGLVGELFSGAVAQADAEHAASLGMALAGGLLFRYSRVALAPQINAARGPAKAENPAPEAVEHFERLHRRSVRINVVVLLALVIISVWH